MIQLSPAARLASLAPDDRSEVLRGLDADALALLPYSWPFWARPDQLAPPGDWRTWLLLGGRGSGKTRSAAEWCRAEVESGRRVSLGVVSPTSDTARRDMIEGPSGLLSVCPPGARPVYEFTLGRITWPSGAVCYVFSGEEPDRIRGPNLDGCWIDELCSMPLAQHVLDMVSFATRIPGATGLPAQIVVTTTPRPIVVLKQIIAAPDTVITRSRTMDNAANLDAATLRHFQRRYAGTTLGRQELDAEILDDVDGALWDRVMLDATRLAVAPDNLTRIVVAIDPWAAVPVRAMRKPGLSLQAVILVAMASFCRMHLAVSHRSDGPRVQSTCSTPIVLTASLRSRTTAAPWLKTPSARFQAVSRSSWFRPREARQSVPNLSFRSMSNGKSTTSGYSQN